MGLHIGSTAPDFEQDSTAGRIKLHDYIGDQWLVLFSHPKDYTPVCTTELGRAAQLRDAFLERDCKMLAVSVDSVEDHRGWVGDIEETQNVNMNFPILADPDRKVATLYDMIHEEANDTLTVRSVFIIDGQKKIRATITYPASTGRNFAEILRVIDSLQLTDKHKLATPADWTPGAQCVVSPALSTEEARTRFGEVTELRPYLRMTKAPDK